MITQQADDITITMTCDRCGASQVSRGDLEGASRFMDRLTEDWTEHTLDESLNSDGASPVTDLCGACTDALLVFLIEPKRSGWRRTVLHAWPAEH